MVNGFCHGNVGHNYDSKLFGYNKNIALDSTGIMSGKRIVNGDQYSDFSNMNCKEGNTDQLKYAVDEDGRAASKLDCSMSVDDSTSDNEKEFRNLVPPIPLIHSSLKIESFEKELVLCADKSVMESELPELVVCYEENTCHVVKDICVDEGVPFQHRFLFDPGSGEDKLCKILPAEDIKSEIAKERVDLDLCIPDILKSLTEKEKSAVCLPIPDVLISSEKKGCGNEHFHDCDSKELMPIDEADVNSSKEIANVTFKQIFSLGELLSMPEVVADLSQPKSSSNNVDEAEQQSTQRPSENTIIEMASDREESESGRPVVHVAEELCYGHHEAVSGTLALDSATKEPDHEHDETVLAGTDLKSTTEGLKNGSRDRNMLSHCGDFVPENCGFEHGETCSSRLEGTNTEPFSSQLQYGHGETSFSGAGPLLGLISYSGPIANSGSVSLRSDSSTTSTCSFAFPILQSEWNSSPVRMRKADGRLFRKHKNWRQGLLCCRF